MLGVSWVQQRRLRRRKRRTRDTGRGTGNGKRRGIIGGAIRSTNDWARDYVRRCLISSCEPVLGEEVSIAPGVDTNESCPSSLLLESPRTFSPDEREREGRGREIG